LKRGREDLKKKPFSCFFVPIFVKRLTHQRKKKFLSIFWSFANPELCMNQCFSFSLFVCLFVGLFCQQIPLEWNFKAQQNAIEHK
jgi:hypothetical protein